MELNLLIGGPGGPEGLPNADARRAGRPGLPDAARRGERPHHAAGRLHHRAQPRADGEDGRLLLDVALQRAIDQGWHDGPRIVPAGTRRHPVRRPPRPDGVPTAGARHHAVERGRGDRQRGGRGARLRPLPDPSRRQGDQGVGLGRGDVAQHAPGREQYSDEEFAAIADEAHRAGVRVAAHAAGDPPSRPASGPASTASSTASSPATTPSR